MNGNRGFENGEFQGKHYQHGNNFVEHRDSIPHTGPELIESTAKIMTNFAMVILFIIT